MSHPTEPARVRLVADYRDDLTAVTFPAGTILVRTSGGQYTPEGAPLGSDAIASYRLIELLAVTVS